MLMMLFTQPFILFYIIYKKQVTMELGWIAVRPVRNRLLLGSFIILLLRLGITKYLVFQFIARATMALVCTLFLATRRLLLYLRDLPERDRGKKRRGWQRK